MKVTCIGTGSSGNCFHVQFERGSTFILDAGVPPKELLKLGLSMVDKLVLITHEHGDHIAYADEMSIKYGARIALTEGTTDFVHQYEYALRPNHHITIDGLDILPFTVIHNAVNPVGYLVTDGYETLAYITDTGLTPPQIAEDIDVLIIEANYTPKKVEENSLMAYLTGRTSSEIGHLSSEQTAEFAEFYLDRLDLLLLMHVSKNTFSRSEFFGSSKISKEFKDKAIFAEAGKTYQSLPF